MRNKDDPDSLRAAQLQQEAAARLIGPERQGTSVDAQRAVDLLHELRVHQIELEMQNQELQQSRLALEIARDRYADLYDFAPVGYVALNAGTGRIIEANLTAAELLGVHRKALIGCHFSQFVHPRDRSLWATHFSNALQQSMRLSCQLTMQRGRRDGFEVRLDSVLAAARDEMASLPAVRVTLTDITEMRRVEREREAFAQRLTEMSRRLAALQDAERKRLSSELHDRSSPNLATLALNLSMIGAALPAPMEPELAELLADTHGLINDTVASIRDICNDLRPPVLDYAGLYAALESYVHAFRRRTGMEVIFEGAPYARRHPAEQEALLLRIAKEALTNCARHSHANTIRISIVEGEQKARLVIADDGVGFDPTHPLHPGLGLITMRELAEFSGGAFRIDSGPGLGTRIEVSL